MRVYRPGNEVCVMTAGGPVVNHDLLRGCVRWWEVLPYRAARDQTLELDGGLATVAIDPKHHKSCDCPIDVLATLGCQCGGR